MREQINPTLPGEVMEYVFEAKAELTHRTKLLGLTLKQDQLMHMTYDGKIYVMANPIVHIYNTYDSLRNVTSTYEVPNIHMVFHDKRPTVPVAWNHSATTIGAFMYMPTPQVVVLIPSLIIVLAEDGTLLNDGKDAHNTLNMNDIMHMDGWYVDTVKKYLEEHPGLDALLKAQGES